MKKKLCCILIVAMLAVSMLGCGPDGQDPLEGTRDLRAEIEALKSVEKKENSTDAYAASLDALLQAEQPAGAIEGGMSHIFLGESRAYYFKKHFLEDLSKNWDELAFLTGQGEKGQERFGQDGQGVLRNVGPVVGTDHYLTLGNRTPESEEESPYVLTEMDENGQKVREIPLAFPDEEDLDEAVSSIIHFAMDGSGTVHLTQGTAEGWKYRLLSAEGELLTETILREGDILELVPLYDGRIAFWTGDRTDREIWKNIGEEAPMQTALQYLDAETGKVSDLSALEEGVYFCTLLDKKTLLYANRQGVYRSDLSGKSPEPLYLWVNHGIQVRDVHALQADGPDKIRMIYEEEDGCHYLCLEPSPEETADVCEITLAVSSVGSRILIPLAVEFNKRYPGCHIKIKENYEETALLTELIAGKGPVLVDTELTGFADLEELWEPLDLVFEQLGITEALWPAVLEAGKINGTQYGVGINCCMRTLITADPDLEDWDYDTFLQLLEQYLVNRPDAEGVFNSYEGYGAYFIETFFIHGVEDSYFWDAEKGTTEFNSEKFRRVLDIAKKYVEDKETVRDGMEKLQEGNIFCRDTYLFETYKITWDRLKYGEKIHYIGYPTKNGASHKISTWEPLAIRRTASEEEKLAAYAFLDFCLSYEGQRRAAMNSGFLMSVRKDVLEEVQLVNADETVIVVPQGGDKSVYVKDYVDPEKDGKILHELFDQAEPWGTLPKELVEILEGELGQYFSGAITEDMLIDHLENRVGLYLKERK